MFALILDWCCLITGNVIILKSASVGTNHSRILLFVLFYGIQIKLFRNWLCVVLLELLSFIFFLPYNHFVAIKVFFRCTIALIVVDVLKINFLEPLNIPHIKLLHPLRFKIADNLISDVLPIYSIDTRLLKAKIISSIIALSKNIIFISQHPVINRSVHIITFKMLVRWFSLLMLELVYALVLSWDINVGRMVEM